MKELLSITSVLSSISSILLAILILMIMITVHEFGHYIAGKIFKFKINEFAIGMGPAILKRKNKTTGEVFSVRALPLGGFCAFEGEDEDSDKEDAFNKKEPWKRLIVLVSGAFMNLIVGVLVLILSVGIYGQLSIQTYDIKPSNLPEFAGYSLVNDDIIMKVENKPIFMATDLVDVLKGKKQGDIVEITVKNNGEVFKRRVRLRNDVNSDSLTDIFSAFMAIGVATIERIDGVLENSLISEGDYLLRINDNANYDDCTRLYTINDLVSHLRTLSQGDKLNLYLLSNETKKEVSIDITENFSSLDDSEVLKSVGISSSSMLLKYATENVKFSFFETIGRGVRYSFNVAGTIFRTLGELLTGKLGVEAVGGPISTISMTSNAIKQGGFNYFLEIMGFIGINLATFNLLPIPALDGSRAVFTIIEWIRKKPVSRKIEGVIHGIGLIVLLGFCILVDVLQFI